MSYYLVGKQLLQNNLKSELIWCAKISKPDLKILENFRFDENRRMQLRFFVEKSRYFSVFRRCCCCLNSTINRLTRMHPQITYNYIRTVLLNNNLLLFTFTILSYYIYAPQIHASTEWVKCKHLAHTRGVAIDKIVILPSALADGWFFSPVLLLLLLRVVDG